MKHGFQRQDQLYLYHYTDFDSAIKIVDSGVLKASKTGAYGPGVYFTDLRPWKGKERLLDNNWKTTPDNTAYRSRAGVCFEFVAHEIEAERMCDTRKIWTVPNDIFLSDFRPKLFVVYDDKDTVNNQRGQIKKLIALENNQYTAGKLREIKVVSL